MESQLAFEVLDLRVTTRKFSPPLSSPVEESMVVEPAGLNDHTDGNGERERAE